MKKYTKVFLSFMLVSSISNAAYAEIIAVLTESTASGSFF